MSSRRPGPLRTIRPVYATSASPPDVTSSVIRVEASSLWSLQCGLEDEYKSTDAFCVNLVPLILAHSDVLRLRLDGGCEMSQVWVLKKTTKLWTF